MSQYSKLVTYFAKFSVLVYLLSEYVIKKEYHNNNVYGLISSNRQYNFFIRLQACNQSWHLFVFEYILESFSIDLLNTKGIKNLRAACWETHKITNNEVAVE